MIGHHPYRAKAQHPLTQRIKALTAVQARIALIALLEESGRALLAAVEVAEQYPRPLKKRGKEE